MTELTLTALPPALHILFCSIAFILAAIAVGVDIYTIERPEVSTTGVPFTLRIFVSLWNYCTSKEFGSTGFAQTTSCTSTGSGAGIITLRILSISILVPLGMGIGFAVYALIRRHAFILCSLITPAIFSSLMLLFSAIFDLRRFTSTDGGDTIPPCDQQGAAIGPSPILSFIAFAFSLASCVTAVLSHFHRSQREELKDEIWGEEHAATTEEKRKRKEEGKSDAWRVSQMQSGSNDAMFSNTFASTMPGTSPGRSRGGKSRSGAGGSRAQQRGPLPAQQEEERPFGDIDQEEFPAQPIGDQHLRSHGESAFFHSFDANLSSSNGGAAAASSTGNFSPKEDEDGQEQQTALNESKRGASENDSHPLSLTGSSASPNAMSGSGSSSGKRSGSRRKLKKPPPPSSP